MPEPLTLDHFQTFEQTVTTRFDGLDRRFDNFAAHFDETMRSVADTLSAHTERFDRIDATLADHTQRLDTQRLDRLEKLLDLEHRFERFESETRDKLRKVGQHLAIPELTV